MRDESDDNETADCVVFRLTAYEFNVKSRCFPQLSLRWDWRQKLEHEIKFTAREIKTSNLDCTIAHATKHSFRDVFYLCGEAC